MTRWPDCRRPWLLYLAYWHPVAATAELDENPVKLVKILGESLVLFRDCEGQLGLMATRALSAGSPCCTAPLRRRG